VIFHPPNLALLLASALTSTLIIWASFFAVRLLRHWDLSNGAETQIQLERQTYLVSTLLAFVMLVELASLILFVFNADRMAVMFVGAMCAVGTLNASVYGFPALLAKIAVFFAAGLWLALNHADGKGRDYPLIREKYQLLLGIAPLILLAAGLQLLYFLDLKADTLTSCCGKMFTSEKTTIAGEMAGMNERTALYLFYGVLAAVLAVGTFTRFSSWGRTQSRFSLHAIYGSTSMLFFLTALAAIISVISLYIYEHPHHHCPFCLLKREYNYFGFLLYAPLFLGTVLGLSAGILGTFRQKASLENALPPMLNRFILLSMTSFGLFAALASWAILSSGLRLLS
jgi:uncharacterized membrane protein